MPKFFLSVFCLFLAATSLGQYYIGTTKDKVKEGLTSYAIKTNVTLQSEETDSTLSYHLRDEKFLPADFIYSFDVSGKCFLEKRIACDSCVKKYTMEALANKKYSWIKIRDNTYVSKYHKYIVMAMMKEDGQSVLLTRKVNLTKHEYQDLIQH